MAYYATYQQDETGALQKVVINAGVGFVLPFYGETAPPGTLACDGSEISRATYDELFQVLGTKAGAGDGVSTFNLPDFRGDFIRCIGGNAAELGVEQGDAIRNITGSAFFRNYTPNNPVFSVASGVFSGTTSTEVELQTIMINTQGVPNNETYKLELNVSRLFATAAENRPVNVALLWCIIYE